MGKVFTGTFNRTSNFRLAKAAPLDDRDVVQSRDDLYSLNWERFVYNTMLVKVLETKEIWMLLDSNHPDRIGSWKCIYGESSHPYKIHVDTQGITQLKDGEFLTLECSLYRGDVNHDSLVSRWDIERTSANLASDTEWNTSHENIGAIFNIYGDLDLNPRCNNIFIIKAFNDSNSVLATFTFTLRKEITLTDIITASVDDSEVGNESTESNPSSVEVKVTGENYSKNFEFKFKNLKGKDGVDGKDGERGPQGYSGSIDNFVVLSEKEYSRLEEIDPNKFYFIYEDEGDEAYVDGSILVLSADVSENIIIVDGVVEDNVLIFRGSSGGEGSTVEDNILITDGTIEDNQLSLNGVVEDNILILSGDSESTVEDDTLNINGIVEENIATMQGQVNNNILIL